MNKKLIAAAVSAAVMAPVGAQADGHTGVTVYGRINNAIDIKDVDGGDSTTDISSVSSRFGIKASADLGNGMTANARYEFATVTDKELPNPADLRIGTVGISGSFGSIDVGNQWSAFYDIVGTHIDPTYSLGYYIYSSFVGGPYRASNTIKYSNSFGPVYLEFDVRLNESDEPTAVAEKINGDGFGIGASFAVGENITLAAAFDSEDGSAADGTSDTDRTGLAAKATFGGFYGLLGWMETDVDGGETTDMISLYVGTSLGDSTNLMLGYQDAERDVAGTEADQIILGVYHNMGGGLKLYFEGTSLSSDEQADIDRYYLGMRIDF